MIRLLVVVVVLVLGLSIGRCGRNPESSDDSGNNVYPSSVREPSAVYYGPQESDDVYPSTAATESPTMTAPVYYGPQDDVKYPDDVGEPADVYYGPQANDDDDVYPSAVTSESPSTPAPVYFGPPD